MTVCGAEDEAVGIQIHGRYMLHKAAKLADPQFLGIGAVTVALFGGQRLQTQRFVAGGGGKQLTEGGSQNDAVLTNLPAVAQAPELAELEDAAVLLVQTDLRLDLFLFQLQQMLQIQLVAKTAEEGYVAPGGQGRTRRVWAWGAALTCAPKVDWG